MKKRIISFSLLLLMVLGITSCKGKQEEKQYLKKVDNIINLLYDYNYNIIRKVIDVLKRGQKV